MTTKELKAYIDRTLGNSVRCLLPSYWWKRLFGVVLDRVDEVSIQKVGSVQELNALGLEEGSIASVVGETHSFSECYLLQTEDDFTDAVLPLLTPIKSIEMVGANPQVEIVMYLVDVVTGTIVYMIVSPEENLVGALILKEGVTETIFILATNGHIASGGVNQLNSLLSSGNVVFATAATEDGMNTPAVFHFVDQIIKWGSGASAYLKDKKEWVRLLKDGESTIPQTIIDLINDKQDVLVSGENIKTINGQDILGSGDITISGGDIDTSNFATKQELATKQDTISDLSTIRSNAEKGASAVQPSSLAKVATSGSYNDLSNKPTIPSAVTESTVSGWGFTKNTGTVTGVKVNGSTKSPSSGTVDIGNVVTSVKINGLSKSPSSGVVDLGTVITDISGKQDKITDLETIRSGAAKGATAIQEVKTINGESIVGSGNIELNVDTSTFFTKDEFADVEEVWAASYNLLNQKISDVQQYIYDEAASRRQFDEAIAEIQSIIAENESVVTAAWNQLNIRINALEAAQRG